MKDLNASNCLSTVTVAESYATLKDPDKSDFLISFYDSWAILLFFCNEPLCFSFHYSWEIVSVDRATHTENLSEL